MNDAAPPPDEAQARHLLDQVDRLVLVQTNIFIRELLRTLGKRPGANKKEFRDTLEEAIHEGKLTQQVLNDWLYGVEGWGAQHVYAFSLPPAIVRARALRDERQAEAIAEAAFPGTWRADTSHRVPEDPEVMRIDYRPIKDRPDQKVFLVEWHERTDSWIRDKARDGWVVEQLPEYAHPEAASADPTDPLYQALLIDGDTYRFDAFRRLPARSVMRFGLLLEPRFAENPIGALFLRIAVNHPEHQRAVDLAWRDLGRIRAGGTTLASVRNHPWNVSTVIKKLDDEATHAEEPDFASRKTRFSEGRASVEFFAPDLRLPETIAAVKLSIPATAIGDVDFLGSEGDFRMQRIDPQRRESRPAHVQLFHDGRRLRIWTELDELDVWSILETLYGYS